MSADAGSATPSDIGELIRHTCALTHTDGWLARRRHHRIARLYRSHDAARALQAQLNQVWLRQRELARAHRRADQPREVHHSELRALTELGGSTSATDRELPCERLAALGGYLAGFDASFSPDRVPDGHGELFDVLLTDSELLSAAEFPLLTSAGAQVLRFGGRPYAWDDLERLGVDADAAAGLRVRYDATGDCFVAAAGRTAPEPSGASTAATLELLRVWVLPDDPGDPDQVRAMADLTARAGACRGVKAIMVLPRDPAKLRDESWRAAMGRVIATTSQNADYYGKGTHEPDLVNTPPAALVTGDRWEETIDDLAATLRGDVRPNLRANPGYQTLRVVPTATAQLPDGVERIVTQLHRDANRARRHTRVIDAVRTARELPGGAAASVRQSLLAGRLRRNDGRGR